MLRPRLFLWNSSLPFLTLATRVVLEHGKRAALSPRF
jgi:hypothetical protein